MFVCGEGREEGRCLCVEREGRRVGVCVFFIGAAFSVRV